MSRVKGDIPDGVLGRHRCQLLFLSPEAFPLSLLIRCQCMRHPLGLLRCHRDLLNPCDESCRMSHRNRSSRPDPSGPRERRSRSPFPTTSSLYTSIPRSFLTGEDHNFRGRSHLRGFRSRRQHRRRRLPRFRPCPRLRTPTLRANCREDKLFWSSSRRRSCRSDFSGYRVAGWCWGRRRYDGLWNFIFPHRFHDFRVVTLFANLNILIGKFEICSGSKRYREIDCSVRCKRANLNFPMQTEVSRILTLSSGSKVICGAHGTIQTLPDGPHCL